MPIWARGISWPRGVCRPALALGATPVFQSPQTESRQRWRPGSPTVCAVRPSVHDLDMATLYATSGETYPAERPMRLGPSLCRRTRIEEDLILLPHLVNRDVTMPEDDEIGVRESTVQTSGPTLRCAAVMDKGYANSSQFEHPSLLQDSHEVMVVVTEHCIGLDHGPQFLESLS